MNAHPVKTPNLLVGVITAISTHSILRNCQCAPEIIISIVPGRFLLYHSILFCHSTADGLDKNKDYEFRVRAKNAAGVGKPSPSTGTVTTKPKCSKYFDILKHWLNWQPHNSKHYFFLWHLILINEIVLGGFLVIWFVVLLLISIFCHISEKATAPSIPNIDKVGRNSVDLSWTKPRNDGGSKIKGMCLCVANTQL